MRPDAPPDLRLDVPPDVPALIRRLLTQDAGRPRVTWYGPDGERVEFSAKTLNNWVAKTANLLVDELGAGPGATVGIALPAHWRSVMWLLAGWSVGVEIVVLAEPDAASLAEASPAEASPAEASAAEASGAEASEPEASAADGPAMVLDVLVTDRPSSPPAGTQESQLVVVTLPALASRFLGDVPTGAVDAAAEIRLQPDAFVPGVRPGPDSPAFTVRGTTVPYGRLLSIAGSAQTATYGVRLLTGASPDQALEAYLAPLVAGGSVVIHHDLAALSEADRQHLISQEHVTALLI